MECNPEVTALVNELAQAIEIIMNPNTRQQSRMEAYVACERFKEASPLCAQAGLYLAGGGQYSNNVKHFGLQLIEYTIKFKWNGISQQEKLFIKENAMKLLMAGIGPAEDKSLTHLKDALSRIIVEMIKREWPQQWTTLLSELSDACSKGEAQTELVLMIFLRLVEDVALLQTIESNQRKKDIYQALTVKMNEIFEFFLRLIELHVTGFRETTAVNNIQKAAAHSRVVEMVLLTLTGFVEWVSISHIFCQDGKLLYILCVLLTDPAFQINAAECLSQIVNRKGQAKERKPLLLLFSEETANYLYRSSQEVSPETNIEQNHLFLKKLINVLTGLAHQLAALWNKEATFQRPVHFGVFLETIYLLNKHPSLTIAHGATLIWNVLLKHDQISKDPLFIEYIPKVIEVVGPRVIKICYPVERPTVFSVTTETYLCMDYDSEEEFTVYYHRCRADFLEIFRQATLIAPLRTFAYCENWLNLRLSKSRSETLTTCSIHDPIYMEWEALVAVLDGVLSRILLVTERPSVQTGLRLLEDCLKAESNDPLILSVLLSCISALFVFLSMSSCQIISGNCVAMSGVSLLPRVLEKVFAALVFKIPNAIPNATMHKDAQSQAAKNLRRHAASLMVKLGHKYPLLLLPVFEQICSHVNNLVRQQPQQISKNEQFTLHEALLLISNHFCDYERQTAFIAEITQEAQVNWLTLSPVYKSVVDFMSFIGLNKSPVENIESDPCLPNRSKVLDALNSILGVIKRCSWPDDPDRASRGGFVIGFTESGNPICRNPATKHVVPILPHVLALLRVLNELFKPEALNLLSDGYKYVHTMLEHEKKTLMGVSPVLIDPMDPSVKKIPTAFDKMQLFLTNVFEGCYHMMGSAGPSLGRDLYQLSGIADAVINSSLACLENVPDYRLRPIIRVFLKPFIYSCPAVCYDQVLLPILAHLTPFMLYRLTARWRYITSLYESGELNGEVNDTQEVLEDMLNRTLTREYLDILKIALVGGQIVTTADQTGGNVDVAMDNDELSMDGSSHPISRATHAALTSEVISDLGTKLLRNQTTSSPILLTILSAISWNDGSSSLKAVHLSGPVIRFLDSENLLNSQLASSILTSVLQGLQVHGLHEANQSSLITLGVQVFENLRPKFPTVLEVMHQIPNINVADLQKLDEKISVAPTKGNKVEKVKKDLFRKITAPLIGKSINQLFRQEIQIANLPTMPSSNRNSANLNIIDTNQDSGISKLFLPPKSVI